MTPIRAKATTPPTTAPAIVPAEVDDEDFGVDVLVLAEELVGDDVFVVKVGDDVGDEVDARRALMD
jgi:hypothetical protein